MGHCDTSGVRLRSLANGVHKSSRGEGWVHNLFLFYNNFVSVSNSTDDKSGHRKDQSGSKPVDTVEKSDASESKSETLANVTNPPNGSSDPKEISGSKGEINDLNPDLGTEPPDIDKSVNQSNNVESVPETEKSPESVPENSEAPTEPIKMET